MNPSPARAARARRRLRPLTAVTLVLTALAAAGLTAVAVKIVQSAENDPAVVTTDKGDVRGTVAEGHRTFLGIPYAAPPTGDLRWASPEPAKPWDGVHDATEPASACPQDAERPTAVPSEDEDCLYLNVTTPEETGNDDRPVIVWLHGGDFDNSAGHVYEAGRMASENDAVVVTLNYRLGALGFLAHPELDASSSQGAAGDFGLEDQQAAMRWVRENASAFGGDSENVTLMGESAGATAACAQLTSPEAEGLFDQVILQSSTCTTPFSPEHGSAPRSQEQATEQGHDFAASLGCDGADVAVCLRAASPGEILSNQAETGGFGPVYGSGVLPDSPADALEKGSFANVPVMLGITRDEYRMHAWGLELANGHPLTEAEYATEIERAFGAEAQDVLATYPASAYEAPAHALSAVMTDHVYAREAAHVAESLAGQVPVHVYEFAEQQPPWFEGQPPASYDMGAYHSSELPYLFEVDYAEELDSRQQALSGTMTDYWTNFARTGEPGGEDAPHWPAYDGRGGFALSLASGPDGIGQADFAEDHHLDFWDSRG